MGQPGLIEPVSGPLDHRALSRYFKIVQPQPVVGGHMTAEGNEAVARLIAARVLEL